MAARDIAPRLLPISTVTVIAAVWATTPLVEVKVEGSAVLLQPDSRVGFYARSAGQVQSLAHRVGDTLRQGEVVLRLDRIDQASAGQGAVGVDPGALQRQAIAIRIQQEAIRAQISRLITSNQPVGQQLKALEALRREEVIPLYSPLWVGAQDLYLRNQGQIKALEGQLAQLEVTKAQLQGQQDSLAVLAPRAGMLLSLNVNPGQAVLPGQRLGTIGAGADPRSRQRTAVALFSDADASRLRPGLKIQLDPLLQSRNRYGGSAERWGLIEGRILRLTPTTADLAEVSRVVGDPELAANLMARSRQAAVGEGGDPVETTTDRLSAPVVLAVLELESADTPSGLRWSSGRGPALPLDNGTPALAKAEVERRSALSFLAPFLRWLGGAER
ncbi:MAG: HlyD family efflux transporter periplasmic adaptor subunit [Cyanobacteriota bacterium]